MPKGTREIYMLRLENIKIREDLSDEEVVREACKKYQISFSDVEFFFANLRKIQMWTKHDNISFQQWRRSPFNF